MKKTETVRVKFIQLAVAWGFANYRGDETSLPATDKLAQAIATGRVQLLGDGPKEFKAKIREAEEKLIAAAQKRVTEERHRNLTII